MTPQESSMLEDLVRKVEGTPLTEKDPEAEQLLLQGLGRDPDAIYKLAQTVLVQNLALNQARVQFPRRFAWPSRSRSGCASGTSGPVSAGAGVSTAVSGSSAIRCGTRIWCARAWPQPCRRFLA